MQNFDKEVRYEEELSRLRHELELRGGPPTHIGGGGPSHGGASHPPPNIGNGQGLFGGIMANPPGAGGPGLAPLPQEQQTQQQQQGPPQHQIPQPPAGPQPPQQPPFSGYGQAPVNGIHSPPYLGCSSHGSNYF